MHRLVVWKLKSCAHTAAAGKVGDAPGKVGDASAFPHPTEEEGASLETELKKENRSKRSRKVTYTRGG